MERKEYSGKTGAVFAICKWEMPLREVSACLGDPHFVEDDPTRTHSGIERYWVFDLGKNIALAFRYHDVIKELYCGSNHSENIEDDYLKEFIPVTGTKTEGKLWD